MKLTLENSAEYFRFQKTKFQIHLSSKSLSTRSSCSIVLMRCQGHSTAWFVVFLLDRGRWCGVDSFRIGNRGHSHFYYRQQYRLPSLALSYDHYQNTGIFSAADDNSNNNNIPCRRNRLFHLQCSNTDHKEMEDDDNIDDEDDDDDDENKKDPRRDFVLEQEEPLSVIFQRGLILQRSGQYTQALQEYKFFVKAAEQCDVPAAMYAEVHVNMGAVYLRQQQQQQNTNTNTTTTKNTTTTTNQHHRDRAKHHFLVAIQARPLRTAYVNLALLLLQEGTSSSSSSANANPSTRIQLLQEAKAYLYAAIDLKEDPSDPSEQTKKVAAKLLEDVYTILGNMMRQE